MKRISTGIAVAAIALIPLGAVGCGGDDPEPAAAEAPATESQPEPAATKAPATDSQAEPAAAEDTAVNMIDNAFEAKDVTVSVGDTITWTNAGQLPHTATATDGEDFDSGSVAPGGTFEWTAEKAGTVTYVCTFHPGMEGTITVR
jgi:plastocyanin